MTGFILQNDGFHTRNHGPFPPPLPPSPHPRNLHLRDPLHFCPGHRSNTSTCKVMPRAVERSCASTGKTHTLQFSYLNMMDFIWKTMDFVQKTVDFMLQRMDLLLKMMHFVLRMMDFILTMMDFVLKLTDLY